MISHQQLYTLSNSHINLLLWLHIVWISITTTTTTTGLTLLSVWKYPMVVHCQYSEMMGWFLSRKMKLWDKLTNTMLTNVCSLFWLTDLGQWADWCSSPGNEEESLGELGVGQVGDGIHDGVQTVHWDHDHHEAGQVKSNNPERERKSNLGKDL